MNEKILPDPTQLLSDSENVAPMGNDLYQYLVMIRDNLPKIQTFGSTLSPASVNANSESTQTFTVNGLTTQDIVVVNKPSKQTGLSILDAFVVINDSLSITFRNFTGSPIVPTSEQYLIAAVRR